MEVFLCILIFSSLSEIWTALIFPCSMNCSISGLFFNNKYSFQHLQINQFSSVQSLSHVWLFATPWITARQASLSITISRSSLRLTSIESVMPSSHLILGRPLLLQPPNPPSIRAFSNESTLRMRWPKYWSLSFSIIPSKEVPGLISSRMNWLDLLSVQINPLVLFCLRNACLSRVMTIVSYVFFSNFIILPFIWRYASNLKCAFVYCDRLCIFKWWFS